MGSKHMGLGSSLRAAPREVVAQLLLFHPDEKALCGRGDLRVSFPVRLAQGQQSENIVLCTATVGVLGGPPVACGLCGGPPVQSAPIWLQTAFPSRSRKREKKETIHLAVSRPWMPAVGQ